MMWRAFDALLPALANFSYRKVHSKDYKTYSTHTKSNQLVGAKCFGYYH